MMEDINLADPDDIDEIEYKYRQWVKTKPCFNLDCYYCIHEPFCDNAHTWKTGEKECYNFRGG